MRDGINTARRETDARQVSFDRARGKYTRSPDSVCTAQEQEHRNAVHMSMSADLFFYSRMFHTTNVSSRMARRERVSARMMR